MPEVYYKINVGNKTRYIRIANPNVPSTEELEPGHTEEKRSAPQAALLMTEEEKNEFCRVAKDPSYNWEKSCCTYIFQQELAGYFGKEKRELTKLREKLENMPEGAAKTYLKKRIQKHENNERFMEFVHGLSTEFIEFEKMICNPPYPDDPARSIAELKEKIRLFKANLDAKIDAIKEYFQDNAAQHWLNSDSEALGAIQTLCNDLKNSIGERVTQINYTLLHLVHPTTQQMRDVFSMHNVGEYGEGLGVFSSRCLMDIRDASIGILQKTGSPSYLDTMYDAMGVDSTTRGRMAQAFEVSSAVAALSDIGANLDRKMFSLSGAGTDSYRKTPQSMIDALTVTKDELKEKLVQQGRKPSDKIWVSVSQYNPQPGNIKKMDEVLCLATGASLTKAKSEPVELSTPLGKYRVGIATRIFAGFVDLVPTTLRGLAQVLLIPFSFGEQVIRGDNDDNYTARAERWLSTQHEAISISKGLQERTHKSYHRLDEPSIANPSDVESLPLDSDSKKPLLISHDQALHEMMAPPESAGNKVLNRYSARGAATYAVSGLKSAFDFFVTTPVNTFLYFASSTSSESSKWRPTFLKSPETVYEETMRSPLVTWQLSISVFMNDALQSMRKEIQEEMGSFADEEDLTVKELQKFADALPVLNRLTTDISSPFEVLKEIFEGLSDVVIDKMFRKSPAFATLYFMVSMTTLGTLSFPTAFLWMKSVAPILQAIPHAVAPVFTGKTLGSLTQNTVACFLEWKLSFFSSELANKAAQGKLDDLKEYCQDPESLAMVMAGLIAAGVLTQFIPMLPSTIKVAGHQMMNPYADVLNFFIEESKSCSNMADMNPARGLEFAFLGLKFGLLIKSLLSGSHKGKETALQALVKNLHEAGIFVPYTTADDKATEDPRRLAALTAILDQSRLFNQEEKSALVTFFSQSLNDLTPDAQANENAHAQMMSTFGNEAAVASGADSEPKSHFQQAMDKVTQKPINKLTFDELHHQLKVTRFAMKNAALELDRLSAPKYYDYVYQLERRYNEELRTMGRFDKVESPPSDSLKDFYNQYCYRGSNTLLRAIAIVPFLPVTYTIRILKYAGAVALGKPSVQHQVAKSFAKDFMILVDLPAMANRVGKAFVRAVGYSGRVVAVAPGAIVVAANAATGNAMGLTAQRVDSAISQISPHRPTTILERFWAPIRSFINRQANLAATTSALSQTADDGLKQLGDEPPKSVAELPTGNSSTHIIDELTKMRLNKQEREYLEVCSRHHIRQINSRLPAELDAEETTARSLISPTSKALKVNEEQATRDRVDRDIVERRDTSPPLHTQDSQETENSKSEEKKAQDLFRRRIQGMRPEVADKINTVYRTPLFRQQ